MEQILHYVWKHKLFQRDLKTTEGLPIEVIDVGLLNTDDGPDFFNATVKIDDQVWSGNIEIHKTSTDWYRHKHENNKKYNSVILHVVKVADRIVHNELGKAIPQCEIAYPKHIDTNIDFLLNTDVDMPCCNYIKDFPSIYKNNWLNVLLLERLGRKSNDIDVLLKRFNNSWTDVFYVLLSRSMGFGLNSDAFERLALSIPLSFILKQADRLLQIEALLFGQAGLLFDSEQIDEYLTSLQNEYSFLRNKYNLEPIDQSVFRKLRVRPSSSVYIRISQLASLLQNIQGLFQKVMSSKDIGQIRLLFHHNTSSYWHTHYSFANVSPLKSKYIGDASLDVMIINTVVPLLFSFGKKNDNDDLVNKAIDFLEKIKPESNSIIKQYALYGLKAESAYDSQAFIQLKREYCEKRKCLYCQIGYRLLTSK